MSSVPDPLSALGAVLAADVREAQAEGNVRRRLALEEHTAAHALALLELAAAEGRLRVHVEVGPMGAVMVRAVVVPSVG